jgi:hypothetical protein
MTKDDGGPAFACANDHGYQGGMSLRFCIAISAMQGMLAHATRYRPRPDASANWHEAISEEAFQIADAMIAEGKKDE